MTRVTLSLTIGPLRLAHVVEHRSTIPPAAVDTTGEASEPAVPRPLARCFPRRPNLIAVAGGRSR